MSVLTALLLLFSLSLEIIASPPKMSLLHRRNDATSTTTATPPIINTTILSPNGTDLTPSFRIKVLYQPQIVAPNPNLTDRGVLSILGRPVVECMSPTATFQHSHCRHRDGLSGSMQAYLVYCQEDPQATPTTGGRRATPRPIPSTANRGGIAGSTTTPHDPPILAEAGSCASDEICVDGIFEKRGWSHLASCMRMEDYTDEDDPTINTGRITYLPGKSSRLTMSRPDGMTPMEMKMMNVGARSRGGVINSKTCTDCFEMKAGPFDEGTNSLKVEANVLGTATAAAAGILWVAVLSG